MTWRIEDSGNGNEVPSIFQIRHRRGSFPLLRFFPFVLVDLAFKFSLARCHTLDDYNAGCRGFFPSLLKFQDLRLFP